MSAPLRASASATTAATPMSRRLRRSTGPALDGRLDAHGCAVVPEPADAAGMRARSRRSTTTTRCSAAASSWRGTASAAASTSTSPIRCRTLVAALRAALYRAARADRQPLERRAWALDVRYPGRRTPPSSRAATRPARRSRRRCCCATARATTTACTRTSTASTCSRCRSTVLLSEPGADFTGGEFVLTEQRPRMQSRAEVVPLRQGDARDLRRARAAGAGRARLLPRQPAPRRQPLARRIALHARHHLPRRGLTARPAVASVWKRR